MYIYVGVYVHIYTALYDSNNVQIGISIENFESKVIHYIYMYR